MNPLWRALLAVALAAGVALDARAEEKVVNLYSARHYSTDEALYANFTRLTGIRVNRIEASEDALLERIRNEGANSPADVFLTVDAGRLWSADQQGLFLPVRSTILEQRIPSEFRLASGTWFGLSTRARVIVYNKDAVNPAQVQNYEDLADPKNRGLVCTRSGGHVYMLSLMAALIEHWGEQRAEAWARGVVANFARPPRGGDTDQIKAVAAGECGIALANTYYLVRLMRSAKPDDKAAVAKLGVVFPNQASFGTHMNVAGGGVVRTAPNRENAIRFLEYLASDEAQAYFAEGNNEWPVVRTAKIRNPELDSLGRFRPDTLNVGVLGRNQALAQKIFDRTGYK
jgi:iron(III) transport system substrate-binding protein